MTFVQMSIFDLLDPKAPALTFQDLMAWGYNSNEAKVLAAGFSLVKYDREAKQLSISAEDPRIGWMTLPSRETFAAAERDLEKMVEDGLINIAGNKKGTVLGMKCTFRLRDAGFEFYRSEGIIPGHGKPRIKIGSKNWGTWKKFDSAEECKSAWEQLLNNNAKALED